MAETNYSTRLHLYHALALVCMLLLGGTAFSQKIEVEKKIRRDEFPAIALQWLEKEYPDLRKDRYFQELGGDTINYEAKFCWEKHWYSIEFLKDGQLKDIEKQVDFDNLPEVAQKKIKEQLDGDFKKWRVSKCQEQSLPNQPGKRYEIEIKGRDERGAVMYEYLFAEHGGMISKREILLPPNLINQY